MAEKTVTLPSDSGNTGKAFAFETKAKGSRLYWEEVQNTFGTLPQKLIITR